MPVQYLPPIYDTLVLAALKANASLTALIGGASTPRIYPQVAPASAIYPLVLYYFWSGGPMNMTPRADTDQRFTVAVWASGPAGYGATVPIFRQVFYTLHNSESTLSLSGWTVYHMRNEAIRRFTETEQGIQYYRYEGDFVLKASQDN